jgi:hypothetical protein
MIGFIDTLFTAVKTTGNYSAIADLHHYSTRPGVLFWPQRSPDLTPCDFFFVGIRKKEAVYVPSLPINLDHLKKNHITAAMNSIFFGCGANSATV